jgi:glucose-1-phosphate thymidylyltransferase
LEAGSRIEDSRISNSIVQADSIVKNSRMDNSLIGKNVNYTDKALDLSLGDFSTYL